MTLPMVVTSGMTPKYSWAPPDEGQQPHGRQRGITDVLEDVAEG